MPECIYMLLLYLIMCKSKRAFALNGCRNKRGMIVVVLIDIALFVVVICIDNRFVNAGCAFLYYFRIILYMRRLRNV
jgi:hypothetical protein